MVSRSFVRAFQSVFRKSLDSKEINEYEDISSDASVTGDTETNKSEQCKREERIEFSSLGSYFANVQPRTPIIKTHENQEQKENSTQNEMTAGDNIEKPGTSKEYMDSDKELKDKEKMRSVSPASTSQENPSNENHESCGSSVIPDSQDTGNISPPTSASVAETDCRDSSAVSSESECSFNSSPKGIYDLCEAQPKFYSKKEGESSKKEEGEKTTGKEENAEGRDRTRTTAKKEGSKPRKRKSVDEELGTVIVKKVLTNKKKACNENKKACKSKKQESTEKFDMLIRSRLPLSGSNRKKLFAVKLSKLISLVSNKRHPLNKYAGKLSVENLNLLNDSEFKILIKILSHFACVKIVRR